MSVKASRIADLQEKIDRIAGAHRARRPCLPFGVPEIDNRIHGWLAFGSTHEFADGGSDTVNGAAAASFTARIAARTKGPMFWCMVKDDLFAGHRG
jgi:protein ImuA